MVSTEKQQILGPLELKIFNLSFLFPKEMSMAPVLQLMEALAVLRKGRPKIRGGD